LAGGFALRSEVLFALKGTSREEKYPKVRRGLAVLTI